MGDAMDAQKNGSRLPDNRPEDASGATTAARNVPPGVGDPSPDTAFERPPALNEPDNRPTPAPEAPRAARSALPGADDVSSGAAFERASAPDNRPNPAREAPTASRNPLPGADDVPGRSAVRGADNVPGRSAVLDGDDGSGGVGFGRGAAPTSADVARVAGVSRATVSYVLNGTSVGRVGEGTRDRVLEAARQLGYVPHAAARALRAGRSGLVVLDNPNIVWGPLFAEFIADLRSHLHRLGYTAVLYGDTADPDQDAETAARRWAELRPTAVVFGLGVKLTASAVDLLKRSGTRAVIAWGGEQALGAHWLRSDLTVVGSVAGEHLLSRGRRRIGVVVPTDPSLDYFSVPRLAGVQAAVAAFARRRKLTEASTPRVVRIDLDYTEDAGAELAARLPDLDIDSIFAYNDEFAMLVAASLQDAGIRIPEDVALVGADDLMLCRLLRPRLTSVRTEMPSGRDQAELIDRLVHAAAEPPVTVHVGGARIVPRASS